MQEERVACKVVLDLVPKYGHALVALRATLLVEVKRDVVQALAAATVVLIHRKLWRGSRGLVFADGVMVEGLPGAPCGWCDGGGASWCSLRGLARPKQAQGWTPSLGSHRQLVLPLVQGLPDAH
eukprot:353452-Chlamydomonas_euryale.AAC.1